MERYNFKLVEDKWQKYWQENKTFKSKIIKDKIDLGLPLDSSVNSEFERNFSHKNFLFSYSRDLIHVFFNFVVHSLNTQIKPISSMNFFS